MTSRGPSLNAGADLAGVQHRCDVDRSIPVRGGGSAAGTGAGGCSAVHPRARGLPCLATGQRRGERRSIPCTGAVPCLSERTRHGRRSIPGGGLRSCGFALSCWPVGPSPRGGTLTNWLASSETSAGDQPKRVHPPYGVGPRGSAAWSDTDGSSPGRGVLGSDGRVRQVCRSIPARGHSGCVRPSGLGLTVHPRGGAGVWPCRCPGRSGHPRAGSARPRSVRRWRGSAHPRARGVVVPPVSDPALPRVHPAWGRQLVLFDLVIGHGSSRVWAGLCCPRCRGFGATRPPSGLPPCPPLIVLSNNIGRRRGWPAAATSIER